MRIWHQSFTVLEDVPAYTGRVRGHVDRVKRPGTQVDLHGLARDPYPKTVPGLSHSRHGFFNAAPRPERTAAVMDFYLRGRSSEGG